MWCTQYTTPFINIYTLYCAFRYEEAVHHWHWFSRPARRHYPHRTPRHETQPGHCCASSPMNSARTRSQMRTKSLCEVSALLPHMFGCGSTLSLKPYAEVSSASLLVGVGRRGTAVPKQAAAAGEVIGRGCPQQAPDAPKHPTACANQPPHASVSDRVDHGSVCCRDYAKLKQARTSTGSKNEQKKRRKKPTLTRHFLTAAEGTFTKAPFSTGYHTFIELNNLTNKQFLFLLMPAFGSSVQATFKQRSSKRYRRSD